MRTIEVATITGRGLLESGEEFLLSPSASHAGTSHIIVERGPEGVYTCDCTGASYGKRCKHVNAAIDLELGEMLVALKVRHEAAGARQAAQMARYQELAAWGESQVA